MPSNSVRPRATPARRGGGEGGAPAPAPAPPLPPAPPPPPAPSEDGTSSSRRLMTSRAARASDMIATTTSAGFRFGQREGEGGREEEGPRRPLLYLSLRVSCDARAQEMSIDGAPARAQSGGRRETARAAEGREWWRWRGGPCVRVACGLRSR